jgi:DNA-binding MarR family transcriptional regulator
MDLRQPRSAPGAAPNIGTLLLEAYRAFERELFAAFHQAGHEGLRPKHGGVLANVPADGTRLTDLAALAGMTKPSMKELVDELTDLGYLERLDDDTDKRVRRIVLTAQGRAVATLARRVIERIERQYARALGDRAFSSLKAALTQIIERKS